MTTPAVEQNAQNLFDKALVGDEVTDVMLSAAGDEVVVDPVAPAAGPAVTEPAKKDGDVAPVSTEPAGPGDPNDTGPPAVVLPEDLLPDGRKPAEPARAAAPRYKSHEEAEAGVRYFQQRATKAEQELARIRAEQQAAEAAAAAAQRAQQVEEYEINRRAEALNQIEKLDPEATDYPQAVARIQAAAEKEIRAFVAAAPGPAATTPPGPAGLPDEDPQAVAIEAVTAATAAAGIDFKTDAVFRHFAGRADDGQPLKDQVAWAIGQTKNHLVNQYCGQAGIEPNNPVLAGFLTTAATHDENGAAVPLNDQVLGALRATVRYLAEQRGQIAAQIQAPLGSGMVGLPRAETNFTKPIGLGDALEMGNRRVV